MPEPERIPEADLRRDSLFATVIDARVRKALKFITKFAGTY